MISLHTPSYSRQLQTSQSDTYNLHQLQTGKQQQKLNSRNETNFKVMKLKVLKHICFRFCFLHVCVCVCLCVCVCVCVQLWLRSEWRVPHRERPCLGGIGHQSSHAGYASCHGSFLLLLFPLHPNAYERKYKNTQI